MWQLNRRNGAGNEAAAENELSSHYEHRLDYYDRSTTSQNILEYAKLQHPAALGSRQSLGKSHSLPVVNRQGSVGLSHRASSAMMNDTFGNFSSHHYPGSGSVSSSSNPFLDSSILTMSFPTTAAAKAGSGMFAPAAAASNSNHLSFSTTSSAAASRSRGGSDYSVSFSDEDLPRHLLHLHRPNNNSNVGGGGSSPHVAAAASVQQSNQVNINTVAQSPTPHPHGGKSCNIGPSKLYRLIAAPPSDTPLDWDVILRRALTHPHEACFFDPNAGGHVFALHRLLRRTGDDPNCRPPFPVVEAVMKACPRAVTRKQAVVDEEDDVMEVGSNSASGDLNAVIIDGQILQPPPQLQPPLHEHGPMNEDDGSNAPSQRSDDDDDHDDVRFEYPLAIACEWEQDGEVIRLLASSLKDANPVYRSEVLRSLDYASLPKHFVRILLEENPNCVLERGTSSEENEGDDDDSPLEQLLFWWDDPDMLGMEDDIASYPDCNMKDDLCDLYEKLRMMLYAAVKGSMNEYDDNRVQFQVLHHVLRIATGGLRDVRFPNDFAHAVLLIAKFIQRERVAMFQERDDTGSLPLHIACSGQGLIRPSALPESENNAEATTNDNEDAQINNDAHEDNDDVRNDEQAQDQSDDEAEDDDGVESDSNEGSERISIPPGMEVIGLLLENNPNSIRLRDSLTGSLPLHLALECNPQTVEVIEKFIDIFPLSISMPDGNGRLPLHIALLQRSPSWEKILFSYPAALESRDPVTGLLPFQLAALSSNTDGTEDDNVGDNESVSLCFQLLRKNPCLAIGLGKMKSRPQSLIEQQIMARYKPRVLKLEEENERLKQRIKELESQLHSMATTSSVYPQIKKRKSSANPC